MADEKSLRDSYLKSNLNSDLIKTNSELNHDGKNPAAVALGRKGGLIGGKMRAASMSADERSAIARKAALARWNKKADKK